MTKVNKPWGWYTDIYRNTVTVFKEIYILPGQSISYQKHNARCEFWYIVGGKGSLKLSTSVDPLENYSLQSVGHGESIEIGCGVWHKLINIGKVPLIIYEMQYGNCSEDDIERIQDDYNRQGV